MAIVYSHRFGVPLDENWYHRWQTRVIAMFSQAVEHCGAIPVFFDVDQWLAFCGSPHGHIDFMINLNAGNRSLDQWALVPALSVWRGVPSFPCSAFTAALGEAKDIATIIARDSGWRTPRSQADGLTDACEVIRKPRTFGSSVGLTRLTLSEAREAADDDYVVEEFVRGYDATIVTLYSATSRHLECRGVQVMVPSLDDPEDWVYDSFEKRNPGVRTQVGVLNCPAEPELAAHAVALTRRFGGRFVSRIDVRLKTRPSAGRAIPFSDCVFLEINPMPTIGPANSVTEFAARYVEEHCSAPELAWIDALTANRIERAAIYLLACGLHVVSSK
ncbi:MAG TPA: hypothetical protein VEZ20_03375 [Allosphingosinicella sp.]|nr:hypothetical protein [Allosphingosinicella sp.]